MATNSDVINVFFQSKPCLSAHVFAIRNQPKQYEKELWFLCRSGTFAVVSSAVRARILAALHITSKHKEAEALLEHCEAIDVSKALTLLDRPRLVRQMTKKIQSIEDDHPELAPSPTTISEAKHDQNENSEKRKRRRKIDDHRRKRRALEADLKEANHSWDDCKLAHDDTAVQELILSASVSGALARKVKHWAKMNLQSDFLEFVLLTLPSDPWKNIADLVHFSPSDFSVPYFLGDIHKNKTDDKDDDYALTSATFVTKMRELVQDAERADGIDERFFQIAEEFPQTYLCYSFVRTQPAMMSRRTVMEQFAARAPLSTVIWYYEEFHKASRMCEGIISERLHGGSAEDLLAQCSSGVKSKATYGKLVERVLTFRRMGLRFAEDVVPIAEARLEQLKSSWAKDAGDAKVAVFGDASYSMQRAIEAATIFASMASACLDGELSFFQSELVRSPHERPDNARETLDVCDKIRANNCTSNAAALWPYYEQKKVMDLFVMVTDEFENTPCHGHRFADLFDKYLKDVNPNARLVIVCVGKGDSGFRQSLRIRDIRFDIVYIDETRPDLAKFDALLGQLAMVSRQCVPGGASSGEEEMEEEMVKEEGADGDGFVLVETS